MRSHLACLSVLSLVSLTSGALGCGSRSHLLETDPPATGGAGGTGGTGGSTGSSTSSTTTSSTSSTTSSTTTSSTSTTTTTPQPGLCGALVVQPTFVVSPASGIVTRPRTALLPATGDVVLATLVTTPGATSGQVLMGRLDAFAGWPPAFTEIGLMATGVIDYELGPGPKGPVALVQQPGTGALLFPEFFPQGTWFNAPINEGDDILFVTAIQDRYFYGQVSQAGSYDTLSLGSYQPGSLPQNEQPLVCMKAPLLAAAVPSGDGFVAAFTAPGLPGKTCDPMDPKPGSYLSLVRYDSPIESGSFLQQSQGAVLFAEGPEAFIHMGLTPASFGAWLVFQSDGSTALTPPPIFAGRFNGAGFPAVEPLEVHQVTPGGYIPPEVAVASLGDTLAVAWVDTIDPSASTVQIQLVHPDGSDGPSVTIPTQEAWLSGGLRLLASPDGKSLLVSWAGPVQDGVAAVARVDCVDSP